MRVPLGNAGRTRLAVFYLHWTCVARSVGSHTQHVSALKHIYCRVRGRRFAIIPQSTICVMGKKKVAESSVQHNEAQNSAAQNKTQNSGKITNDGMLWAKI